MHNISKSCRAYIFNWSYFQVFFTVIHRDVAILLRKSKNDGAIRRNMLFMVRDSFPFYMGSVQSRTGTEVTGFGSATETKSDRSEFIFRPVPCKRMKRNVQRSIRTHTGLSPSRSHVITPSDIYYGTLTNEDSNGNENGQTAIEKLCMWVMLFCTCRCTAMTRNFLISLFHGGR